MRHAGLIFLLVIFTILTVYNSVLLPLGEADDETDHYQYHRFVAQTGHPPLTEAERREAGFKGGLAPLYYWLTAWPIALVGQDSLPDIRRVDARPERYIPTDGLGINHVLHTLDETWPWRGQALAWHLVRLLSLPMAWVTIIATYALAYRLRPDTPTVALGAAALVAFLPRFVISSAVINDDNLVFALTALLLLVQVIILQREQPPTPKIMALFGALFGLTLVTKYFSLILVPEILFTLWFAFHKKNPSPIQHSTAYAILAFLIALLLTAGLWFGFIILRFNRIDELGLIPGLAASLGEPQITEGLVGLLSGQSVRPVAATYTLPAWFGLLYRSFWFEYGWMRVFAPIWIYALFALFSLIAVSGLIHKYWFYSNDSVTNSHSNPIPHRSQRVINALLILHVSLFLVVVLARYILSATIDTGQGRHLFPALPVIAYYGSVGLHYLFSYSMGRGGYLKPIFWPIIGGLLVIILFVAPALISLQPANFILPKYETLPVTTASIQLPTSQQFDLELADGLTFQGFEVEPTVSAGEALPVSLYWHAEKEAQQDYFISLCLHDDQARPVGCWRGQFGDGRYPARAWETGDTLIDTVFIPIPVCYRLTQANYSLHLDVWPLDPASPTPIATGNPILTQSFTETPITITPTDSLLTNRPQTIDLWQADQQITTPTEASLGQTLSVITYATDQTDPPILQSANDTWSPLPPFETPIYLPCDDGPTPFARLSYFVVSPTLTNGTYQTTPHSSLPPITVSNRDRVFAPVTTTLTFSQTLTPLQIQLPNSDPIALSPTPQLHNSINSINSPTPQLPITLRWQTRRWMADPLVIALKLLDKDFNVGGERVATLGDRYPNVLWVPGEVVEETYPLRLNPDAPPGLYRLEVSLLHQDESLPDGYEILPPMDETGPLGQALYPVTIRLLDPAHDAAPAHPFEAQIGKAIELTGFEVNPNFSDSPKTVSLALYWQSTANIDTDYTVFTQLIGPDGQVWAQWDNPPQAGRYPTTAWSESDRVVDRYQLTLRDGAPAGDYRLLVGMYDPASGERLPIMVDGQPQPDNALELTTLSLTP